MGRRLKKPIPYDLEEREVVKVTSRSNFKGVRLGLVEGPCKYDDGVVVWLATEQSDLAKHVCIQLARGDTIVSVRKKDETPTSPSDNS